MDIFTYYFRDNFIVSVNTWSSRYHLNWCNEYMYCIHIILKYVFHAAHILKWYTLKIHQEMLFMFYAIFLHTKYVCTSTGINAPLFS